MNLPKPKVALITTGGTIAGVSYGSSFEIYTGQMVRAYRVELSGAQVLNSFSSLEDIADIELCDLGIIDSVNMTPLKWCELAETIFPYLHREDISGIVVTHGTDTMEDTAMALSLMLRNLNKPVVLTGAMLPIDQDRAHVQRHLEDSVLVAASGVIPEVVLCFSGDRESRFTNIYRGSTIFKYSSRGSDSFRSTIEHLAMVRDGKINVSENYAIRYAGELPELVSGFNSHVGLITLMPCDEYVLSNYNSSVLEGMVLDAQVGVGINPVRYEFVKKYLDRGVPVAIRTSIESNLTLAATLRDEELEKRGAIALGYLSARKAMVKMRWVLAQTAGDIRKTKEMMRYDFAGEVL